MKVSKKKKSQIITWIIFVAIIVIAIVSFTSKPNITSDEELARCIGKNSILYVQLGCSHCDEQKDLFGGNDIYLTVVDCFYDSQDCIDENIEGTPTWKIKGEYYKGVKTLKELKELTGC